MLTDLPRIRKDIENLARFNATPGKGLTRFSLTSEDRGARNYLKDQLGQLDVKVYEDAAGSLFGRRDGADPSLPPIMVGSHFDSVKNGGNFDGQAGVVTGLEILRCLEENNIRTDHPVEMAAMIEEEGGRFKSGLLASRAMALGLSLDELEQRRDEDGISIAEAMRSFGFDPSRIGEARRNPGQLRAFIELHIEQGPLLEKMNTELGIVSSIVGTDLMRVNIKGRPDHAGTTPMDLRRDALQTAAAVISMIPSFAMEKRDGTVATVGTFTVRPGAPNIVPGEVEFTVDTRSHNASSISMVKKQITDNLEKTSRADGTTFQLDQLLKVGPVAMDKGIRQELQDQAEALGFSWQAMSSGAGHDAMVMASVFPSGMVFVPSKEGRSHCPEEWTDYADLQKGIELVYHTVISLGVSSDQ